MCLTILLSRVPVLQLPGRCCPLPCSSLLSALTWGEPVSHCSFPLFPVPFCQGDLMCPKLSSSPLFYLAFKGVFKACQETSRTQVGRGGETWQTGVLMPAIVWSAQLQRWPRLPKRYWPFFISLSCWERTSNPFQLKPIDVSGFSYCVWTHHTQQWWKLQSAQEHQLDHGKNCFCEPFCLSSSQSVSIT